MSAGFEISDIFTILPKLAPLWPDIKAAIDEFDAVVTDPAALAAVAEAEKVMGDPKVKAAIATFQRLAAILKAAESVVPTWQQS
jgi:hypothetical protein